MGVLLTVLITCLIIGISLVIIVVTMMKLVTRPIIRDLETFNAEGTKGRALYVVRPGLSSFPEAVADQIVKGLTDRDWIVDLGTPSEELAVDLTHYNLLIVTGPTYGARPQKHLLEWTENLGDLNHLPIAVQQCAMGSSEAAILVLKEVFEARNGNIIGTLGLNTGGNKKADLLQQAYNFAFKLELS